MKKIIKYFQDLYAVWHLKQITNAIEEWLEGIYMNK